MTSKFTTDSIEFSDDSEEENSFSYTGDSSLIPDEQPTDLKANFDLALETIAEQQEHLGSANEEIEHLTLENETNAEKMDDLLEQHYQELANLQSEHEKEINVLKQAHVAHVEKMKQQHQEEITQYVDQIVELNTELDQQSSPENDTHAQVVALETKCQELEAANDRLQETFEKAKRTWKKEMERVQLELEDQLSKKSSPKASPKRREALSPQENPYTKLYQKEKHLHNQTKATYQHQLDTYKQQLSNQKKELTQQQQHLLKFERKSQKLEYYKQSQAALHEKNCILQRQLQEIKAEQTELDEQHQAIKQGYSKTKRALHLLNIKRSTELFKYFRLMESEYLTPTGLDYDELNELIEMYQLTMDQKFQELNQKTTTLEQKNQVLNLENHHLIQHSL